MAANITVLPSAKVPLIYDGTTTMSTEWYRFFYNIYGYTVNNNVPGAIPTNKGGTGQIIYTDGQLLIGNSTTGSLNKSTLTAGTAIDITNGAGSISIANTGVTSLIAGSGISVSSATGAVTVTNTGITTFSAGTTGFTPSTPTGGAITLAGTLNVANGGTGQTSYTNGQLLIGNTSTGLLTKTTLTAGTNITITNGPGTITIAATSSGGTVTAVTGTAPVVSSGGTTPAISMAAANTTTDGYLTSTDWNTFNSKGSGTVTSVSVVSANGFAGTVATATSTPAITLTTSITGILKGNATAISAATSGTDYAPGTSANTSGLVYSTTTTGALTTATGAQVSTALGSTAITGNAANVTGIVLGANGGTGVANTGFTITVAGNVSHAGSFTQTFTATGNTSLTLPTTGTLATLAGTETLTNKRVTPRVSTTTSSATPTINTDNVDMYGLTAQAVNITSFTTNLSGTPTDGQKLWIYIVGTAARTIAWGASFEASTVALPTTTVTTNRLDVGFVWNVATSKWRCVAVA